MKIKCGQQKSQIDFVVIQSDCIWVLESKSISGQTTVDEDGKVTREKGETTRYPTVQAKIQANNIKNFLLEKNLITEDFPIKYRVVFTDLSKESIVKFSQKSKLTEFIDVELISTIFEGNHEVILHPDKMHAISDALILESKRHSDRYVKQSDYLKNSRSPKYQKRREPSTATQRYKEPQRKVATFYSYNRRQNNDSLKQKFISIIVIYVVLYIFASIELSNDSPATRPEQNKQTVSPISTEIISSGNETLKFSERDNINRTSTQFKEVDGVLLVPESYSKQDILDLLNDYDSEYDYAKITITTNKKLFDHYATGVSIKSSERITLENNFLIGEYLKNSCYQEEDNYNKSHMQFRQLNGKFASLYGQFFDV